jgi:anti-sigma factor RsiW
MIDDQDERLLQDELDGVASPEGSKRLQARLAQSAEVRARHQELQTVSRALDQVRLEEVPTDLKEGVMAAIAAAERANPARTGWLESPGSASRKRPVLAWAYPFLAGAVSGGLLIALVTGNLAPRARTDLPVIGAMLPGSDQGRGASHSRRGGPRTACASGSISRKRQGLN